MNLTEAYRRCLEGEDVTFRPRGFSMTPVVRDNQEVTVLSLYASGAELKVAKGDVVLCKVKGKVLLHLVLATQHGRYLIGNARGRVNGWTHNVVGVMQR